MVKNLGTPILVALLWLSSTGVRAHGNEYLGIGMGSTHYQSPSGNVASDYPDVSGPWDTEPGSSSFKLFYSTRVDNLSLDLEFTGLGDINETAVGNINRLYSADTWSFTTGWHKQLTPRIRSFARLGIHAWEITDFVDRGEVIDKSTDLTYGLGADIDFRDPGSYLIRVGWDHYEVDSDIVDSSDVVTFNLVYQFGADNPIGKAKQPDYHHKLSILDNETFWVLFAMIFRVVQE